MSDTREPKAETKSVSVFDHDVDHGFKFEIANSIGGEGLLRCLKCGACSGGCPVSAVAGYRPRRVLGNALLGLRDRVLSSHQIWECAACFTCEERCVQEVKFTDVVTVLRNMAVKEGRAPKGYLDLARAVVQQGRTSPRTHAVDKIREELNLPPLQEPAVADVQKIVHAAGFDKILAIYSEGGRQE